MGRVLGEIGDDEDLDELKESGLGRHRGLQGGTDGPAEKDRGRDQGEQDGGLDEQVADAEMREVRGPSPAEYLLSGQAGEEMLEGHEDSGQDEEVQEKPVETQMV